MATGIEVVGYLDGGRRRHNMIWDPISPLSAVRVVSPSLSFRPRICNRSFLFLPFLPPNRGRAFSSSFAASLHFRSFVCCRPLYCLCFTLLAGPSLEMYFDRLRHQLC
jgi:hypothetical protein